MPTILPFRPSIGAYSFRTILLETEYIFPVRWNSQDNGGAGAWYFDVREVDQTPIIYGVKIVLGTYLGRVSTHRLFRDGAMVARVPQGGDRREAGFDDIGERVQVWYFTRDEVASEIVAGIGRSP